MPIYDYICANGHTTEVIHGVNDPGPASCPVCGASLRKAMSAPTIHFKGSGWAKKERSMNTATAKSGEGDKSGDGDKAGEGGKATTASSAGGESAKPDVSKPAGATSSEAS